MPVDALFQVYSVRLLQSQDLYKQSWHNCYCVWTNSSGKHEYEECLKCNNVEYLQNQYIKENF